jgi:hypothetical protein
MCRSTLAGKAPEPRIRARHYAFVTTPQIGSSVASYGT